MSNSIISIQPLGFPWATQDPFLFCVHHLDEYPSGDADLGVPSDHLLGRSIGNDFVVKDGFRMYHGSKIPGFPYHPHKGFETITINLQGFVDHTDSLGAAGRFGAGDVQWMTAGKGVLHSEMFPMVHSDKENTLEIFQIWLNLPAAKKSVDPYFKMLWAENIPIVKEQDSNNRNIAIRVIAGNYKESQAPSPTPDSWAADPNNGISIQVIHLETNANWELPRRDLNIKRNLYFYKGHSISIEKETILPYHSIQLNPQEETRVLNGNEDAYLLLLEGKPIDEPVAKHGPFVMNTQEEVHEAFAEYRRTQFGGWPWPAQEYVHAHDKGRFALYPNGKEEVMD